MSIDENNSIEDSLLAKFLAGDATPEEAILVDEWIEASEENRLRYLQFEKIWHLGSSDHQSNKLSKDLYWKKLSSSLTQGDKRSFLSYRIAAGIFILLGITIGLYYFSTTENTAKPHEWNVKQTSNEIANLNLPDGSAVTVNRHSQIQWPDDPGTGSREVNLDGEAFFDVSHNAERPFIVSVDEIKIKVLGTAFNISNASAETIETEVIRGKVMMYNSQGSVIVEAGMKGVYSKITKTLSLLKIKNENNVAYATHILTFESISLKEVCKHLSKTYGVQFIFENKKIEECTLTSAYSNKSLAFIMDVISESLGTTYQIKGTTVYISGDGCL